MNTMASPQVWILDAKDRCDRCGAQAYVMVKGVAGELMFCSHDYEAIMNDSKGYSSMMAFMLEVVDEREKLQENRLQGDD